ncbi:MAG TPA: T9SS type A sorting domain-containing protein [Caldithrix abyssi]|uniref:T9SS type A sorting domain-containing protein n=1 Tax=Caldithrix abyssi TaxID=187145 RepID=A0A7V1LM99_CALAY|nr:T9SS type A sorting domain-containing protein [Caldithrix abyssi]
MKNIFTRRLPLMIATMFLFMGTAQAQLFPTVSGTVTLDSIPVPGFTLFLSPTDTTLNIPGLPQETAEDGTYSYNLIPGVSYTITAYDTFSYMPFEKSFTAEGTNNYIIDIALEARAQDAQFAGSVAFQGNAVATDIYLLKLDDSVDLSNFEEVESYYAPPVVPVRWASYHFMSDDNGNFNGGLLFGKYVIYVPGNDQYLPYWSAFEASGDISAFAINLVEKVTVSGTVSNFEGYSYVKVGAFSINAGRPFSTDVNMQDGTFNLDVAPGEYVFQVTAFFFVDEEAYTYIGYYDGKSKPSEADHVMIEGDTQGIDFTLPNPDVSPFTVTGMVTSNQSGAAISGAHVTIVSVNAAQNTMRSYDAVTDEKGMYTINAQTLLAEDSLIAFVNADGFFAEFYDNQTTFLTADKVVFHPNDVITLDFGLDTLDTSNGYKISGTVTDTLGNPIPFGQVTAYTTATNIGVTYVMVDSLGNYSFDAIFPSGSTVYLQCWAGYDYKPQVYDHAETWEDATPIRIDNADIGNANFELEPMPASRLPLGYISGTVVLGNNGVSATEDNPYEGISVYLRDNNTQEIKQVDFVDENGSYTLPIETYGSYEVVVSAPGHEDLAQDVDVTQESGLDVTGVEVSLGPTGMENPVDGLTPKTTQLYNAYPNPFNPSTTILVDMARTEVASLTIYNVAGQKVATLYNGVLPAGKRQFTWHGVDNNGHQVASGLYFYQLRTKGMTQTKSIIFLK